MPKKESDNISNDNDFFTSEDKNKTSKKLSSEGSDHKSVSFIKLKDDTKTEIKYIYHLSDIHIRNTQRHVEYGEIFVKVYQKLKLLIGSNKKQSLIVLTGDIMHTKTELSPEAVSIACQLFKSLNEIATVILIAGNHDCNLSNKNRLDALTPIVEDLANYSNFYYLKKSGLYQYYNIIFGVTSIFDEVLVHSDKITKDVWSSIKQKNKYKIALYHGPVHGAKTDVGYRMHNEHLTVEDFTGYHYVLLGDIHRYQYLNKEQTIAYAGSLIQQSYGENLLGHGILKWDLIDGESELIEISNDYGYCTIRIIDGKIVETKIPRKPRIRFILENTNQIQYQEIFKKLDNEYQIVEVVKETNFKTLYNLSPKQKKIKEKVTAYLTQEKIIKSYLNKNGLEKEKINDIIALHKKMYQKILSDKKEQVGNIMHNAIKIQKWKILELRFSNILAYGKDNVIDFRNYDANKIIGIVAPNHYGKSAILDIILFCLFDKFSRGDRRDILNKNEKSMYCSLLLAIGSQKYLIERIGQRNKNGLTVKIDVNFYQIRDTKSGEIREKLNGLDKNGTNKKIGELIGDYYDYLTTCFSLQQCKTSNFIDMTQLQKKEYLNEILKLNIFEDCYNMARDKLKKFSGQVKILEQKIGNRSLEEIKNNIKNVSREIKLLEKQKQIINNTLTSELEYIIRTLSQNQIIKYHDLSKYNLQMEEDIIKSINEIRTNLRMIKTDIDLSKIGQELENDKNELATIENTNRYSDQINELMLKKENLVKQLHLLQKLDDLDIKKYQNEKMDLIDKINTIKKTLDDYKKRKLDNKLERIDSIKQSIEKLRNTLKPVDENAYQLLAEAEFGKKKHDNEKIIYSFLDQTLNRKILNDDEKNILTHEIKIKQKFAKYVQNNINELSKYQSSGITNDKIIDNIKKTNVKWIEKYQNWLENVKKYYTDDAGPNMELLIKNGHEINKKYNLAVVDIFTLHDNQIIMKQIKLLEKELDTLAEFHGTKKEIENLNREKNLMEEKIKMVDEKISEIQTYLENAEANKIFQSKIDDLQKVIDEKMENFKKTEVRVKELKQRISQNEKLVKNHEYNITEKKKLSDHLKLAQEYYLNYQSWFLKNNYLKKWIDIKKIYDSEIHGMDNEIEKKNIQLEIYKKEIEQYLHNRREYDNKISETNLYQLYVSVMNYNGLPYEMLKTYLPLIEADVNQILHSMVNFNIEFMFYDEEKMEEQKSNFLKSNVGCVDINICQQNIKPYNINLASGFERFIIGLAMRMALFQISLTAKPNFIIIDEGWSCLDSENLGNIGNIMDYIKSQYEHVIIISHLEEIRNQADYVINIEKNNGYSYIKADKKIRAHRKNLG